MEERRSFRRLVITKMRKARNIMKKNFHIHKDKIRKEKKGHTDNSIGNDDKNL